MKPTTTDAADAATSPHSFPLASITRQVYLGVPAETVWPWLVEPELARRYQLADLAVQPTGVGNPMQFTHRLAGQLLIDGEVLEWVEGRRLAYSYQFQHQYPEPPSRVTLELLHYGDRMCCLELRHEELLAGGEAWEDAKRSWDIALSSLKTLLETGAPLPWPTRSGRQRW